MSLPCKNRKYSDETVRAVNMFFEDLEWHKEYEKRFPLLYYTGCYLTDKDMEQGHREQEKKFALRYIEELKWILKNPPPSIKRKDKGSKCCDCGYDLEQI